MKKILATALALCMALSLLPTAVCAASYDDTEGHWAEAAIERWSAHGVIQGDKGKFRPDAALTRAHMATILCRLLRLPAAESAGLLDVTGNEWYADAIDRCAASGILRGDGGYAYPNRPITRQQAMVMLCRALGIAPLADADLDRYTDGGAVSDYAVGYVAAMTEAGIVKGTSDTTLSPYAQITRAATVTILDRAIERYADQPDTAVTATGSGLVLVVADGVHVTAPEGTAVTVAQGVEHASVNGVRVGGGRSAAAARRPIASGGSSAPAPSVPEQNVDITVSEASALSGTAYAGKTIGTVTITDAVGNGEVTLRDMTITGDLIVRGGGSNSIVLNNCTVEGTVIMDKTPGDGTEGEDVQQPRLALENGTQLPQVEVRQPAILECESGDSGVDSLCAKADVTIRGGDTGVKEVTVAAGDTAAVTVKGEAKVDQLTAAGNVTVTAESGCTVNRITAGGSVTISGSSTVGTVEIPANASEDAALTVGEGTTVKDLRVNGKTSVTNNGAVNGLSSDLSADAVSDLSSHYFDPNDPHYSGDGEIQIDSHLHSWVKQSETGSCDNYGVICYTCAVSGCTATLTVVLFPYGHAWGQWAAVDEQTHQRVCTLDGKHKEMAAHEFSGGVCGVCGYAQRGISYPIYIRHTLEEVGTVAGALRVVGDTVTVSVPGYGSATNGQALPVPAMRKGWTYGGWYVGTSHTSLGKFTELTDELAAALIDAAEKGDEIFMDNTYNAAIGVSGTGFSVTQDISSGDLTYTLLVPDGADSRYQLNFVCFDRAKAMSCYVDRANGYSGTLSAALPTCTGAYFAYEVVDLAGNVVASDYSGFGGFYVSVNDMALDTDGGDAPTVTLKSSSDDTLVYEISGLKTRMNYQVITDEKIYFCGMRDNLSDEGGMGSITVTTDAAHPLPGTFTLYGVNASHPTGASDTLELSTPLTVTWRGND